MYAKIKVVHIIFKSPWGGVKDFWVLKRGG